MSLAISLALIGLGFVVVGLVVYVAWCDLQCECHNHDDCPMHPDTEDLE